MGESLGQNGRENIKLDLRESGSDDETSKNMSNDGFNLQVLLSDRSAAYITYRLN
jgi:hypothetical protein